MCQSQCDRSALLPAPERGGGGHDIAAHQTLPKVASASSRKPKAQEKSAVVNRRYSCFVATRVCGVVWPTKPCAIPLPTRPCARLTFANAVSSDGVEC